MAAMTRFSPEARNCWASGPRSVIRPYLKVQTTWARGMTLLALVQASLTAPAQFRAFEPVEHEQRALDAPEFLKCQIKLVLAAVGRKLLEHGGGRDGSGFQRRGQAPHLAPVFANDSGLDPPAQERL
jgi:hypothetical protein